MGFAPPGGKRGGIFFLNKDQDPACMLSPHHSWHEVASSHCFEVRHGAWQAKLVKKISKVPGMSWSATLEPLGTFSDHWSAAHRAHHLDGYGYCKNEPSHAPLRKAHPRGALRGATATSKAFLLLLHDWLYSRDRQLACMPE